MKKLFEDLSRLIREPIFRFLSVGLVLYLIWLAVYEWVIHPAVWMDEAVIRNSLDISQRMLEMFGYEVARSGERLMHVKGTPGLFIGDSCNGISLFALFSIFIIAFPGKWIAKLFFIPLGILLIHFLNVMRIVALAVIETYSYELTEFNHTYTFTLLMYACIFGLWLLWINKFSGVKINARSK